MPTNNTYNYDVNYLEPGGIVGVMTINGSSGNNDILNLNGLTSNDVICSKSSDGKDLIISMKSDFNKYIEIIGWFDGTGNNIEQIYFQDINDPSGKLKVTGQLIVGSEIDDVIGLGDGQGNMNSGHGDDMLFGGIGDDKLNGEKGDDSLQGGLGNDTYIVEHKIGNDIDTNNDTIYDTFDPQGSIADAGVNDTVKFNLGIGDVTFSKDGDNLIAALSSGETLTITNHFKEYGADNYYNRIENFEFQEEGVTVVKSYEDIEFSISEDTENGIITQIRWNDFIESKAVVNTLLGGAGNDHLDGRSGVYKMIGGQGDDTYIVDEAGDVVAELANEGIDQVQSSIDYTLGNNIENLYLSGSLNISGIGNELDNLLYGNSGDNFLDGGAGADKIYGGEGNDIIYGGAGDDFLLGGMGNDTYIFSKNTGNDKIYEDYIDFVSHPTDAGVNDKVIFEGISSDEVAFRRAGNDLIAEIISTGEELTIKGQYSGECVNKFIRRIEQFQFTNETLDFDKISIIPSPSPSPSPSITPVAPNIIGTQLSDVIVGSGINDNFIGGAGDDILHGYEGSDELYGGEGADKIYGGDSDDVLYGDAGDDRLWGGMDNDKIFGGDSNDELYGEAGDDKLWGGRGNDYIVGGAGNDEYIYTLGRVGSDIIHEHGGDMSLVGDSGDSLVIGALSQNTTLDFDQIGDDLSIRLNGAESLTIINQFEDSGVDRVEYFRLQIGVQQIRFSSLNLDAIIAELSVADPSNEAPMTISDFMNNSALCQLVEILPPT